MTIVFHVEIKAMSSYHLETNSYLLLEVPVLLGATTCTGIADNGVDFVSSTMRSSRCCSFSRT